MWLWQHTKKFNFLITKNSLTLSKAIGRESFSIGAETEDVDAAFDGTDALDIIELIDENDDCGRSVYKTSWLFGKETAVVAIFAAVTTFAADETSTNDNFSLSLSGGILTLDNVGSIACDALAPVDFLLSIYFGTNFS